MIQVHSTAGASLLFLAAVVVTLTVATTVLALGSHAVRREDS